MANQIPLSGASNAAGGYLLPPDQGDILTQGLLREAGAIAVAGDVRRTSARQTQFPIWLGKPTAGFVGEGAAKPATGAEFGQSTINVKKVASIVLFTDEMIEDVQRGDLNVLVDSGVRSAINDVVDANAVGKSNGTNLTTAFDSALRATTNTVEYDATKADALELAVSAALGKLEQAGYAGDNGVLLGFGFAQAIRDARSSNDTTQRVYDANRDPLFGLPSFYSTNLNNRADTAAATKILGFVVHRPNLHVRVRKDVTVNVSTEATVNDGTADRKLFQENLTAVRYETRLGFMVHDINNAVVAIVDTV
jgi:HK97 family phage major capsid protein